MNFTIHNDVYHNCQNVTISAMLKRLGVSLEYIWGQAGLLYKDMGKLTIHPFYRDVVEDFSKYYGIQYFEKQIIDTDQFLSEICLLVKLGHTIGIELDVFELPYCMQYRSKHILHAVEVVDVVDDEFVICDHYYKYHGQMNYQSIKSALLSCLKHLDKNHHNLHYFEVDVSREFSHSISNLVRVVSDNHNVMIGNPIGFLRNIKDDAYVGINAIPEIRNKTRELLMLPDQEPLRSFHFMIKEIANSRYHFHMFLKGFSQPFIAEEIREVCEHWTVIANLLLRGYVIGNPNEILPRVEKQFEYVVDKESKSIEQMNQLLKDLA